MKQKLNQSFKRDITIWNKILRLNIKKVLLNLILKSKLKKIYIRYDKTTLYIYFIKL
jgi:hypothetical protein